LVLFVYPKTEISTKALQADPFDDKNPIPAKPDILD
jgi:hypothetical protein